MKRITLWFLAALVVILLGRCAPGAPQTYADCVLQHVKSSMSNAATFNVCKACREKFPLPEETHPVPADHDFAQLIRAFYSQLSPVPDSLSDEQVIACFHASCRATGGQP